jgi:hypothetical protein
MNWCAMVWNRGIYFGWTIVQVYCCCCLFYSGSSPFIMMPLGLKILSNILIDH